MCSSLVPAAGEERLDVARLAVDVEVGLDAVGVVQAVAALPAREARLEMLFGRAQHNSRIMHRVLESFASFIFIN